MPNRWQAYMLLGMSCLLLGGMVLSHLALTDIAHAVEPNLGSEWWTVRITFGLAGLLVFSTVLLARRTLRKGARNVTGPAVDSGGIGLQRSDEISQRGGSQDAV